MTANQIQLLKLFLFLSVFYALMQLAFNYKLEPEEMASVKVVLLKSVLYGAITSLISYKIMKLK